MIVKLNSIVLHNRMIDRGRLVAIGKCGPGEITIINILNSVIDIQIKHVECTVKERSGVLKSTSCPDSTINPDHRELLTDDD